MGCVERNVCCKSALDGYECGWNQRSLLEWLAVLLEPPMKTVEVFQSRYIVVKGDVLDETGVDTFSPKYEQSRKFSLVIYPRDSRE